jgi:hypothetical protein
MASLLKKMSIASVVLLLAFIFILYLTLRTKVNDVSSKQPYSEFINQALVLKRSASISKTREPDVQANPYLLTEAQGEVLEDVGLRYILPAGTVVKLQQAKLFRNGVSGFERAYVLGTVFVPELKTEVAFEYAWGKNNGSLSSDEKDSYTFPLALWQDRITQGQFRY